MCGLYELVADFAGLWVEMIFVGDGKRRALHGVVALA